ncbi:MAG: response regulator [Paenibacillaceae bacterium]|nr:response regulator [Paenibacillaceae bacterium]
MIRAYLLDDEQHMLNLLEMQLRELEVEVVGRANNPHRALEQLAELQPDVVFLDIEMPGLNGLEVAEAIQSREGNVQIVYVTAFSAHAVKAFEQQALDYLLKPVEEDRLRKTVQRIQRELAMAQTEDGPPPQASSEQLSISVFGSFDVLSGSGETVKWYTAKVKELFALLIVRAEKGVHRDELIDILWGEEAYEKSKVYLHACVSYVRKALKRYGYSGLLNFLNGKYYLDLAAVRCDYRPTTRALSQVFAWMKEDNARELEQLLEWYRGPLFADCDYPWAREEAESAQRLIREVRFYLAKRYLQSGNERQALETATPLLAECPYEDEVYRLLIQSYRALDMPREAKRMERLQRENVSLP